MSSRAVSKQTQIKVGILMSTKGIMKFKSTKSNLAHGKRVRAVIVMITRQAWVRQLKSCFDKLDKQNYNEVMNSCCQKLSFHKKTMNKNKFAKTV